MPLEADHIDLYLSEETNLFSKIKFYDCMSVDSRELKILQCASLNIQCDVQDLMTS